MATLPGVATSSASTRRPFTAEEDAKLIEAMSANGASAGWDYVATQMPGRSPRQCRERWVGYLSPDIRVEPWTDVEDQHLLNEVSRVGYTWTTIALSFSGRSSNDIKNRWYSHLKDIAVRGPDGQWRIARDANGMIVGQKKKRTRKLVSAYDAAVARGKDRRRSTLIVRELQIPMPGRLFGENFQLPPLLPRSPGSGGPG
jgi:hypothetical protein